MEERWKKIEEWPYEVSDWGRVRSLSRTIYRVRGRYRGKKWTYKGRILKPGIFPKYGYWIVVLNRLGKCRTVNVHQLVAEAFLPPRPCGMEVNHVDGDKANPHYTNLEWKTHARNMQHSIEIGLRRFVVNKHGIFKIRNK